MHTMYVDKPMQGAGLMQAIARVNRTFHDKPDGPLVDYIGIATNLQEALAEYSPSDRDQAGVPIAEMVAVLLEKHDIVKSLLHGCEFNSSPNLSASDRLAQHAKVLDYVMADPERTERYLDQVPALAKAFALCDARDEAIGIRNDVRMFADVRAAIVKIQNPDSGRGGSGAVEIDTAISQLINDQIRSVQRTNIVQSRKFSEQLDEAIRRYTNRPLTAAKIIAELVKLAKEMRDNVTRHEDLGLSVAEAALYDVIAQNDAAVLALGDDTLKKIAIELVKVVRSGVTIDWNLEESARASMRAKVRRLLAKYDYLNQFDRNLLEGVVTQCENGCVVLSDHVVQSRLSDR